MLDHLTRGTRKLVFRVSDQVRHKPACTEKKLKAWNFGFKKKRDCSVRVAKTKALISCAVSLLFSHRQNSCFSHDAAHFLLSPQRQGFIIMWLTCHSVSQYYLRVVTHTSPNHLEIDANTCQLQLNDMCTSHLPGIL